MSPSALDRFTLKGSIAMVTGASGGLGAHFALVLANAGAHVILAARRADKLQSLVSEIKTRGGQARAISMDVSDCASVKAAFDELGSTQVPDVLVNNAGVTVTRGALEQTEEDYDLVMNTNLKGAWLVATEAARRMATRGEGGSIVNVASILGARVAGGVAPYAISKAGLIQATKSLALELARHRIRVNALLPGYVVTDLNRDFLASEAGDKLRMRVPTRQFLQPEDLDGPLLLLASAAGTAMTGSILAVDGGHLVSSL